MKKIVLMHGPNLNMLGKREPGLYGSATLADIEKAGISSGMNCGLEVSCYQSNHEGELVERIHAMMDKGEEGLILNAGAFTHTSIAIHDAIRAVKPKLIEVHISNVFAREAFRHHSYLSEIADAVMCGFGTDGYEFAIKHMSRLLTDKS